MHGISIGLIALPGVFCLFLVLRAFFDGNTADLRYAFGVLILFGLALMIPLRTQPLPWSRRLVQTAILLPPILLLFPFTVVVLIFGKVDAAAFVFHLIFGIEGTPWDDFIPYIFTAAAFWVVIFATVVRLQPVLPRSSLVTLSGAAALLAINPLFNDILWNRANAAFGPARTLIGEFEAPALRETEARPDLVIIYLEGFDQGYLDPERFGDIGKPLRDLAEEGTYFSRIHQIEATGWSLAGTLATQCGAPLLPMGAKPLGSTSDIARIMPDLTCLPDILTDRGYDITYMSGAKIIGNTMGYYGFDNYLSTHGGATILDRDFIPTERTADFGPEDWGDWGIYDSELFDGARRIFSERSLQPEPFALFVATMDTHGPSVGISPACTPDGRPRNSMEMREAVACVSKETVRFVRDLMARPGDRGLRIAVFSDHLSHGSNVTSVLEQKTRFNTAMLLGEGAPPRVIDREAAMVDLYPTLLDWLGLLDPSRPQAGLGTSLLADQPTLVERFGLEEVNGTLKVDVRLAQFLWADSEAPQP